MIGYRDKDGFHIVLENKEAMDLIVVVSEGVNSIRDTWHSRFDGTKMPKKLYKECVDAAKTLNDKFSIIFVAERAIQGKELARRLWKKITKRPQTVESASRGKDLAAIFIAIFFFFQWLPYALISRITFIYHFYVSVPFLCLASAYFLSKYWSTKWGKVAAVTYFASVVVMFGLFYSVISGTPAPNSQVRHCLKSFQKFLNWEDSLSREREGPPEQESFSKSMVEVSHDGKPR